MSILDKEKLSPPPMHTIVVCVLVNENTAPQNWRLRAF